MARKKNVTREELEKGGATGEELEQAILFFECLNPCLYRMANGRFMTDGGDKTPLGLFRTARRYTAPAPPTGAEIAQAVKQAQEEAKAIDAYREALQTATAADAAFDAAIRAQFGQNSNRFDHAHEEFNAETKAAYQAKLAADEAWHKARHNAANQTRLALDAKQKAEG